MSLSPFLVQITPHLTALAVGLIVSLSIALMLVFTPDLHGKFTMDHPGSVQTAHIKPTPRVGGLGIYIGLFGTWLALPQGQTRDMLGLVLLAGMPAWLFGLVEDLTKRVSVTARLLATMFSGALACMLFGVALNRLGLPVVDSLLAWGPLAIAFTAFAVGGVANAINIIDGFHGLASGTSVVALTALAFIAHLSHDNALALLSLSVAATVVGFWFVNYPWGKIFLGDGGAYFIGFALAWVAVLLPMRNPEVSPWASLMVCAYPFIEVIYSMVRRVLQRRSMGQPDSNHLHSLLCSQVIRRHTQGILPHTAQNAAVAPLLWAFTAATAWLGVVFRESTAWLMASMLCAALLYHVAYINLARRKQEDSFEVTADPAYHKFP